LTPLYPRANYLLRIYSIPTHLKGYGDSGASP